MINVNSLKSGMQFKYKTNLFIVISISSIKQGRAQAITKIKCKNLRTNTIMIQSFTGKEKIEKIFIEKKKVFFLYADNQNAFFMEDQIFTQYEIALSKISKKIFFLKENMKIQIEIFEDEILNLELPDSVILKVKNTEKTIKENSQSKPQKKIILETNLEIQAPFFIKENDEVIVSTKNNKYLGRVKK